MDWLISLIMLVALEAVLGIDNLLYIAIESGRVDPTERTRVQRIGIIRSCSDAGGVAFASGSIDSVVSDAFCYGPLERGIGSILQRPQHHRHGRWRVYCVHGCQRSLAHARR